MLVLKARYSKQQVNYQLVSLPAMSGPMKRQLSGCDCSATRITGPPSNVPRNPNPNCIRILFKSAVYGWFLSILNVNNIIFYYQIKMYFVWLDIRYENFDVDVSKLLSLTNSNVAIFVLCTPTNCAITLTATRSKKYQIAQL